ncbi:hypothetical protein [Streptomyces longwoodensis]|uniref:hypothetical protein n=1 Tax=Streptomyces longwoodensis TaxID=68231 RepID=UPI0036E1A137
MSAAATLGAHDYLGIIHIGVENEMALARQILAQTAGADIYDLEDMIKAAVGLRIRLGSLVAALDAERGEGQ